VTLNYTSAIFPGNLPGTVRPAPDWRAFSAPSALGLAGVGLLLRPTLHADQLVGGLIGLGSGVLAGMAYFSVRELGSRGEPETRTVFYFSLVSSVCGSVWLLISDIHPVDLHSGALLLGVATFATAAQLAMTRAYAGAAGPLMAAALAYSTVIFASLFGMLILCTKRTRSLVLAGGRD
jgi:drug/metabolite transporter (DMT)-like permease